MAFKIKHKRTGLFLGKATLKKIAGRYKKSNLLQRGKVYELCPSETQLKSWFHHYRNEKSEFVKFDLEDFEIVKI